MSATTAPEWKAKGNELLKAQDFDGAIAAYTEAIKLDPKGHVYFSNRSAAYANKGDYASALKDADECIKIKPEWAKGYSRKGTALQYLGKLQEALGAYSDGLKHDATNASLKDGLQSTVQQLQALQQRQQQWMQQQAAAAQARAAAADLGNAQVRHRLPLRVPALQLILHALRHGEDSGKRLCVARAQPREHRRQLRRVVVHASLSLTETNIPDASLLDGAPPAEG